MLRDCLPPIFVRHVSRPAAVTSGSVAVGLIHRSSVYTLVRKRSYCPPKLLIEVFRSEVCNHVSKGLHCEFSMVSPIHSESLGTWAILFDPFRFDHQIKCIRKILVRCLRFIWHSRW